MGELIRNLHPINIGMAELMIELNEGYTKNEGRLIHIQNKHFRYLLKEKDFLCLAATILRAKEEMMFYRSNKMSNINREIKKANDTYNGHEQEVCDKMCKLLETHYVDYRIVEIRPNIVTFIINNCDREKLFDTIKEQNQIKKRIHPYGEKLGYIFLYQMTPFELYEVDDIFIEIIFQLPCMSLTNMTWIPLHKKIQERIWNENNRNNNGQNVIDQLDYSIYRLCWAVFKNGYFTEYDVGVLSKNKDIIRSESSKELLEEVFFGFTDELISLINNNEIEKIIDSFYNYLEY